MKSQVNRRSFIKQTAQLASALTMSFSPSSSRNADASAKRPNIVWICAEDMSANMSCYGETTIQTPHIDALAHEGTRFTNTIVTCPVCSPSRSAMITGMYQTTIGAHHHRSSRHAEKILLPEPIKLIPEYFKQAGYYTSNGGMLSMDPLKKTPKGKTDYNFVFDPAVYDGTDWSGRAPDQPFFAQFQLRGGKNRKAKVPHPVDPAEVSLPPYYPDHPVLREDWAHYLNSVIQTDIEVGQIVQRLKDEKEYADTIIFFWTDHGISHVRDKQFLYEGGVHVPLVVCGPGIPREQVMDTLQEHIDIPYTSLRLAGIPVPDHVQGRDLFEDERPDRQYIFAARDRCDETVDRIRCVRTQHYKYIRNFFPDRSHTQPNRYKDNKQIMITMRRLFAEGKLSSLQIKPFLPVRPREELYNLKTDPYELTNLVDSPDHQTVLRDLRNQLEAWMENTGDLGQIPEPFLYELTRSCKYAHAILQDPRNKQLARDLRRLEGCGDFGASSLNQLMLAYDDRRPAIRYKALMEMAKLGRQASPAKEMALQAARNDPSPAVRVAAARVLHKLGLGNKALPVLTDLLQNAKNESVRHYAALELEDMKDRVRPVLDIITQAQQDPYEYVKRVATRIVKENS